MSNPYILVADDDVHICQLLSLYLKREGFEIRACYRGDEALDAFRSLHPDLVILDVMMPGLDGWEVLHQIRSENQTPVIMLTAKSETADKVKGFEMGADDYVSKPFEAAELIARVKALLRRSGNRETTQEVLEFPGLTLDHVAYTITQNEQSMELPPKEMELLWYLASHKNQVFTREQLLEKIWGFDYYGDTRTVDVHIKRLREKLMTQDCTWQIKTVWGVGYKFEVHA